MAADLDLVCVRDAMQHDVVAVGPQDSIHDALHSFIDQQLSALPVTNHESRCIGVISVTDLVRMMHELVEELSDPTRINAVLTKWLNKNVVDVETDRRKVATLMSDQVVSVAPDCSLTEAAQLMLEHRVHRLPVLDEQHHIVGIVSTMDILRASVGSP